MDVMMISHSPGPGNSRIQEENKLGSKTDSAPHAMDITKFSSD
jgi:hypothetical protein